MPSIDIETPIRTYKGADMGNWAAFLEEENDKSASADAVTLEAATDATLDEASEVLDASRGVANLCKELAAADANFGTDDDAPHLVLRSGLDTESAEYEKALLRFGKVLFTEDSLAKELERRLTKEREFHDSGCCQAAPMADGAMWI